MNFINYNKTEKLTGHLANTTVQHDNNSNIVMTIIQPIAELQLLAAPPAAPPALLQEC